MAHCGKSPQCAIWHLNLNNIQLKTQKSKRIVPIFDKFMPYKHLYDRRSSFVTIMLSSGKFSINHIAQIIGHTTVDMLIHKYNKFIPSKIRKINKSIGLFN